MKFPPRIPLSLLPTAIQKCDRLTKHLNGPEIWVKRDDQTGLATGGNKVRKLEFLLAEAIAQGCDHVVTMGGPQSNHSRQTAAAAAKLGLGCTLALKGHPQPARLGNLILDELLGAEIAWARDSTREKVAEQKMAQLKTDGKKPYLIPVGGSVGLGALGYVEAMREAVEQLQTLNTDITTMVVASSSAGTQAGMVLGAALYGFKGKILGISIDATALDLTTRVTTIATESAHILGVPPSADQIKVDVNADYLGGGYSIVGNLERQALRRMAATEGILLDPVYTGRAFGGMLDLIAKGVIKKSERILFWHTGGEAAMSAFADKL